jgi:hypothetical protein
VQNDFCNKIGQQQTSAGLGDFSKAKKTSKNFDPHALRGCFPATGSRPDVMDEMKW